MKINEIISEQELDEIPAGGVGQMLKKVGSRFLNKVPGSAAKSKAANLAGQADLGDTANNLHREFAAYVGKIGKKVSQATGEEFADFLKTKKHMTKTKIPKGVLQKSQLNDLLMAVSKEAIMGQGGMPPEPAPAPAKPGIKKGTKKKASDGQVYVWKGAQWISLKTGRVAKRAIGAELSKS